MVILLLFFYTRSAWSGGSGGPRPGPFLHKIIFVVLCDGGKTFSPAKSELSLLLGGFIQSQAAVLLSVPTDSVNFKTAPPLAATEYQVLHGGATSCR